MNTFFRSVSFLALLSFLLIAYDARVYASESEYDVRILRDTWGVPHIFGHTDADAAFGLAYAHSEDNFKTIQESLMMTRGMMGLYSGQSGAMTDYIVHLLRVNEFVEEKYETDLSPETRRMIEGYADGINLYANEHPDAVLMEGLVPVNGKDIVAGFVFRAPFFFGLDGAVRELFGKERKRDVSKRGDVVASTKSFTVPEAIAAAHRTISQDQPMGSNGWSVSPKRTADGSTFLLVNPHLAWEGPTTWYEVHIHSDEGWNMTGGLFPGTPIVTLGHNENLGWTHTVNRPDLVDIYVLEMNPDNPNQYRFDGEWLDLEVSDVTLRVKVTDKMFMPVHREMLQSIHGPALRTNHGVYAIRYAGRGDVRAVEQWFRMNKSRNFDEFKAAMKMRAIHSFNTIYADREGNIWAIYNALLPNRTEGYDYKKYLPGNTSETLWDSYLPFEELPQVFNPDSGYVQNCNSSPYHITFGDENPREEDYSLTHGIETSLTNRTRRALELFEADDSVTFEEFERYKFDLRYSINSFPAKARQAILNAPAPEDELSLKAIALLAAWDLSTNPDNTSAALAVTAFNTDASRALRLQDAYPAEVLLGELRSTAKRLTEVYGRIDIAWEKFNRLSHGTVDVGLGGGPDILHCVTPRYVDNRARSVGRHGDGYTCLVAWDKDGNLTSRSMHQYGVATLDESSPHWADQVELIRTRTTKPVWFTESDIRANLEREYRPGQ